MKLLLVEDETYIAQALAHFLKTNHYCVDLALDGEAGLNYALDNAYDVIILDIMLPKMDGLTVLQELRSQNIFTPVILLTAYGDIQDKVKGLEMGADDYLAKPFDSSELLARLRALTRRQEVILPEGLMTFADLTLNPQTLTLTCRQHSQQLTPKEELIAELLFRRHDTIVSKDLIIEKLWGYDADVIDNHVEIHMSNLRKKINQLHSHCLIVNIRNLGYLLKDK
jgi:DNA-binding response OmpR family regulator